MIKTRTIAFVSLMTAVIIICSFIQIPATIPFTLQTMGIFLALKLLGGYRGTVSILTYILLGGIGLPVFSGFKGGISAITGPTGGYIVGFLLMGILYLCFEKHLNNKLKENLCLVAGLAICYAFGTLWFTYLMNGKFTLKSAFLTCVAPFIIFDLGKLILAEIIATRVKNNLKL